MAGPRVSVAASMLCFALAGCAASAPSAGESIGPVERFLRESTHEAVLVRGWIGAGTLGLEPVMITHAAPRNHERRDGPYRLRVRWDAGRFELLQVRDPASGEILALARDGDIVITSAATELELALSEGVRSLAGVFRAR